MTTLDDTQKNRANQLQHARAILAPTGGTPSAADVLAIADRIYGRPTEEAPQEQAQRAAALETARELLASNGPMGTTAPAPDALLAVAEWIVTGRNPYPVDDQEDEDEDGIRDEIAGALTNHPCEHGHDFDHCGHPPAPSGAPLARLVNELRKRQATHTARRTGRNA